MQVHANECQSTSPSPPCDSGLHGARSTISRQPHEQGYFSTLDPDPSIRLGNQV